jgi:hypothetical protein
MFKKGQNESSETEDDGKGRSHVQMANIRDLGAATENLDLPLWADHCPQDPRVCQYEEQSSSKMAHLVHICSTENASTIWNTGHTDMRAGGRDGGIVELRFELS